MGAPQYEQAGADIGGSGTANTIPRWTGASTLGDSLLSQGATGDTIFLGTPNSVYPLANRGAISINGTSTALVGFTIGGLGQGYLTAGGSSLQLIAAAAKKIEIGAGGAVGMTFDTSNYVGIGTASPNAILSVYNAGTPTISLWNSSNYSRLATNTNDLYIDAGLGGAAGAVIFRRGSGTVDSARIDSSGNLLMAGNGTAANPIIANSTGVSGMYFPSATTVAIAANGAIAATFSKVAGAGVALGGTTGLVFDASGSQQGIKLRATPDSTDTQTLDCYQEGTWSPTLTGFGGTTPTATIARYTRVGRLVTLHVLLTATGGNQFSSTAATTLLTLPSGMTPAADAAGSTSNSVIGADGPCVAYTNGNLYVPTFALRTANTILTVTYSV